MDSVEIGRAQTKLQHYGSSFNNHSNGTRHLTSTSLTMRKSSTMWIREPYGNFFNTMMYLRK
ncbi:unnamed protein product [Schistosoma mattheei]|uniref:Uncharacterized protein n=1 Tax=Schistosoma mattheei TaxID=31246 RepID=A0A3P8G185_9TREM|nr:unnamed protein product [Schistosoma mattheei]